MTSEQHAIVPSLPAFDLQLSQLFLGGEGLG